ncbi:MAG TPA: hypothetical protein VG345_04555 [Bryobacteraceae bacterium]|nr:hypothetical protein [Bryobacteraceae bacterium]
MLHTLQSLIYIAVILYARRQHAWAYGAGCFIAAFWNYANLFATNFIAAGMQQVATLVRTGHLHRPDLFIAVIAAAGHFLLIAGCIAGFLRMRPGGKQYALFAGGGVLAIGYFALIIVTTGPQYIPLLRRVFHAG